MILCHFRWANESGATVMPTPEELEAQGWYRVRQHNLWPLSWLMRKDEDEL